MTQQVVGESVTSATTTVFRGLFSPNGAWKGLGATLLRDGLPHGGKGFNPKPSPIEEMNAAASIIFLTLDFVNVDPRFGPRSFPMTVLTALNSSLR